eukprot:UN00125
MDPFSLTDGSCLQRRHSGFPPTSIIIEAFKAGAASGDWAGFTNQLESYHDNVHCDIHGTMCDIRAANAPEFYAST